MNFSKNRWPCMKYVSFFMFTYMFFYILLKNSLSNKNIKQSILKTTAFKTYNQFSCLFLISKYYLIFYLLFQMFKQIVLLAIITFLFANGQANSCIRMNYLPMPNQLTCGKENLTLTNPCKIFYHVKLQEQKSNEHVAELIQFQMKKSFKCHMPNYIIAPKLEATLIGFSYIVEVQILDPILRSVFTVEEESYELDIDSKIATIHAKTYVGFVRALQTFIQSIQCPFRKNRNCQLQKLPISIKDKPALLYRGLMIDSSRHFLPLHLIFETIDAMMYNKLNVLHWHIVDEDSFPLILDSHPEIAKYASFSPEQTYTTEQARQVVKYGLRRGVRIIPELDTPGHASSWGLAPENKGVACTFHGDSFMGPLDVTLEKTYKLIKEVFAEVFDIFPDPIVHLGGDQVVLVCFQNKTDFIQKEKIQQYEIELQYRKKQHKILKELNPNKQFVYWMNSDAIHIEDGDIVHWWGNNLPPIKHKIIISQYGPFYLDMGVGNYLGVSYGNYQTWLDIYNQDIGRLIQTYPNKDNVLGAEVCLWSQLSNPYVHHTKIWIRSSSFAERVWTFHEYNAKPDVLGRVAAHQKLMNRRGIPTAGATSQQCETHPEYC